MKQITIGFFATIVFIFALGLAVIVFAGCASMCDPADTQCQQNANTADELLDDTAAIGIGVLDIDAALHEPEPSDQDAHRQWCEQQPDHPHCH